MATKKEIEATGVVIELDLDSFTWGDLEDMESNSPLKIRQVLQKFAQIDGVEDVGEYLRTLSINQMQQVAQQFQEVVSEATNPVGKSGKN